MRCVGLVAVVFFVLAGASGALALPPDPFPETFTFNFAGTGPMPAQSLVMTWSEAEQGWFYPYTSGAGYGFSVSITPPPNGLHIYVDDGTSTGDYTNFYYDLLFEGGVPSFANGYIDEHTNGADGWELPSYVNSEVPVPEVTAGAIFLLPSMLFSRLWRRRSVA